MGNLLGSWQTMLKLEKNMWYYTLHLRKIYVKILTFLGKRFKDKDSFTKNAN